MPGGQYTNLLFQASSLGLGQQWTEIKKAYKLANILCGDIIKVTPSSKVVGDFAQFIVQNKLTEKDILEKAEQLSFPKSVVEYFQGYLGIPPYGFPEPLRTKIIRNLPRIEGRPGKSMAPFDFAKLKTDLEQKYGQVSEVDFLSAALYPQVFDEYKAFISKYGNVSILPTRFFLSALEPEEELIVSIEPGKTLIVKFVALGPTNVATGQREVFFQLNGESRVVAVDDGSTSVEHVARPKADPSRPGEVGAPMSGVVVEVRVKEGAAVKLGDPVCVLSAMKMETVVSSPVNGVVHEISVKQNDSLNAGDLICKITKS